MAGKQILALKPSFLSSTIHLLKRDVCRAPQLLMIHLKRFKVDFRGKPQKIQGCIPFPLGMDVKPYCDPKVHSRVSDRNFVVSMCNDDCDLAS